MLGEQRLVHHQPAGEARSGGGQDQFCVDPELVADITQQLKWGQPVNGLLAALDVVPESRGTLPRLMNPRTVDRIIAKRLGIQKRP